MAINAGGNSIDSRCFVDGMWGNLAANDVAQALLGSDSDLVSFSFFSHVGG
jgi:hypothetical protein